MFSRFFALVALVLFSTLTFADEVNVPELTDRAVFAGSVQPSEAQKQILISSLKELEDKNKVQMAILVVDSIKPLAIEQYSMKVAEKWKLGLKGVNNGVLLVVATKDRKARIEVGYGLEGVLTDAMTKRIQMENMIPYFKRGQFTEGVVAAVAAINDVTKKEVPVITQAIEAKKADDAASSMSPGTLFLLIFGGVGSVVGIIAFFVIRSERKAEEAAAARREKAMEEYRRRMAETASYSTSKPAPTLGRSTSYVSSSTRKTTTSSRSTSSSSSSRSSSGSSRRSSSSSSSSSGYSDTSWSSSSSSSGSSGFSGGGGDFGGGGSSTDW